MAQDVRVIAGMALVFFGAWGCQQSPPAAKAPPQKSTPALVSADKSPKAAPNADEPPAKPAEPAAPPVAAVQTLLKNVDAGQLDALVEFLPESYAKDLESLVHAVVEKTPDDVWERLQSVTVKIAQLFLKRPDWMAAGSDDDREKLTRLLNDLADDDAWDRTRRNAWTLNALLQGPASTLLTAWQHTPGANATILSRTEVRLVSQDGDHAVLEIQSPLDTEPQSVDFVRHEGKWIPRSIADGWANTIGQAAGRLSKVSADEFAAAARQTIPLLLQIEGTLDEMLRADRPEVVELGWWQIQSLLAQSRDKLLPPGPPSQVELHLTGELSDEQLTDLLDRLVTATDQPDQGEYVTFPTPNGTAIQLSPVGDFAEFVKRLSFVAVTSEDAKSRRVEIQWPPKK